MNKMKAKEIKEIRGLSIEKLEEKGKITVIRPIRPIEVSRMEKDTAKLLSLYQEGYDIAMSHLKNYQRENI